MTWEDTTTLQTEQESLYLKEQLPSDMFECAPVDFSVEDSVPLEDEICDALKCLKNWKAPGASGITINQLKLWMRIKDQNPNPGL